MTDVRSQRLQSFKSTVTGYVALWTCPAGMVTLVKGISIHNSTTGAIDAQLYLASGAVNVPVFLSSMAGNTFQNLTIWGALNPTDRVILYSGAAGIQVYLSGAVLAGPPPVTPPVPVALDMAAPLPAGEPPLG